MPKSTDKSSKPAKRAPQEAHAAGDLFIVDNSDSDWKVRRYLHDWCDIARAFDIATGYFEIGALLALDGQWQKLERLRILMGDEVSLRTKQALLQGVERIKQVLDASIEHEKETNDFLEGVPAIEAAVAKGQIECRVYRKDKFHAKAYVTHAKHAVVGPSALVGSSNFTYPGLSDNVELNVQLRREVDLLQEWYERHWDQAEDITPEILRVIERHTRDHSPFEVYAKALHEFFKGHELTASEWELTHSKMYPVLDLYQKQGYQALMKIARQHGGAFLCDGVGLGKTFVGLMVIERLIMHERKRVALFVPKAAREDVWEVAIRKYLPHVGSRVFSNLMIFNHTDLGRAGDFPDDFRRVQELADAIVIDEAHHFRNPGVKGEGSRRPSRYRLLYDLIDAPAGSKQMFLLTATPINNRLDDFRHMMELFTRHREDFFRNALGIHSLRGYFIRMEKELRGTLAPDAAVQLGMPIELSDAEATLGADALFKTLVVQRSRAYVRRSQEQEGGNPAIFPRRADPQVLSYSVKKTYGRLLDLVEKAFHKEEPLFILGIYYPLAYYEGKDAEVDPFMENRQKQVVSLIRTQFLKRFESSAKAFEFSCDRLLIKLLAWTEKHSHTEAEKRRLEVWKRRNAELIGYVHNQQLELWGEQIDPDDADDDIVTDEMLASIDELPRDEYRVADILSDTFQDLDQVAEFLNELRKFRPQHDDKLNALKKLLKTDPVLKRHKVLIFSEFAETARYVRGQLVEAGITDVEQIDSATKKSRGEIIRRFSPYYNGTSSTELAEGGAPEIRVLISTDVLSEGLNLQDATRLINYDLHWNPVRLMQRIGRVDRRMSDDVEKQLVQDHPDQRTLRGTVQYWNFLPPDELEDLLRLYTRVSHKTLRISKTFGIEGKKLLRPEDEWDALRDFNHGYEGTVTPDEEMHLEYQQLMREHPELAEMLDALPGRVFSGKKHPARDSKAVFFCYALPGRPLHGGTPSTATGNGRGGTRPSKGAGGTVSTPSSAEEWTEEAGSTVWYLYDIAAERVIEEPSEIVGFIRSDRDTPRHTAIEKKTLSDIRQNIEKHIRNSYLKRVQAPIGVRPRLKAWMELS